MADRKNWSKRIPGSDNFLPPSHHFLFLALLHWQDWADSCIQDLEMPCSDLGIPSCINGKDTAQVGDHHHLSSTFARAILFRFGEISIPASISLSCRVKLALLFRLMISLTVLTSLIVAFIELLYLFGSLPWKKASCADLGVHWASVSFRLSLSPENKPAVLPTADYEISSWWEHLTLTLDICLAVDLPTISDIWSICKMGLNLLTVTLCVSGSFIILMLGMTRI